MSEQTFCKKHEIVLTLNWGCPYCRIEALEERMNTEELFTTGKLDKHGVITKEIAELRKKFANHDCFRTWQKNIKVHNIDAPTTEKPPEPLLSPDTTISVIFHNNLIKQQIAEFLKDMEAVQDNYSDDYSDGLTLGEVIEKWEARSK